MTLAGSPPLGRGASGARVTVATSRRSSSRSTSARRASAGPGWTSRPSGRRLATSGWPSSTRAMRAPSARRTSGGRPARSRWNGRCRARSAVRTGPRPFGPAVRPRAQRPRGAPGTWRFSIMPKGRTLARIYGEGDVLVSEALGGWCVRRARARRIASVVSTVVYESRERVPTPGEMPTPRRSNAAGDCRRRGRGSRSVEDRHQVELSRELEDGFATPIRGGQAASRSTSCCARPAIAGRLRRTCKQLLDLLRQIEAVAAPAAAEGSAGPWWHGEPRRRRLHRRLTFEIHRPTASTSLRRGGGARGCRRERPTDPIRADAGGCSRRVPGRGRRTDRPRVGGARLLEHRAPVGASADRTVPAPSLSFPRDHVRSRGISLSDPLRDESAPTIETRMTDLIAVMDAAGSRQRGSGIRLHRPHRDRRRGNAPTPSDRARPVGDLRERPQGRGLSMGLDGRRMGRLRPRPRHAVGEPRVCRETVSMDRSERRTR